MSKNNHPHIQSLYEYYQKEAQAFRKVHRMIDLFESIIKTYTVVILSEYIKQNKLSDSAKGLLSQGLRTPSLGTWQLFSRVLFEELQKDNYTWLVGEFPEEFLSLDKALNNEKTNVVALRNGYAHGATPSDAQCEEDIKKFEPFLTQLIASKWLKASTLQLHDNKVYLVVSEGELSLHPLLLYRKEESGVSFAFFNDIKNDKIGLLNYPLSKHYREKDFFNEFHEHLPLNEWKKNGNNEFYQRIEELTETFKGRTAERELLLRFVQDKNKGYLSIQGNPGIGKSALIAQFFKDLRVNEKLKHIQVVEYFIRRGTAQANTDYLLNYLIKRTDEFFPQGRDIRAEEKNTWSLQQQLISKWRLWAENSKGNKLLFLIDGLDEGVEDDIIKYLPRENFENILIIYGSRPGGHKSIDELWATLPTEYHTKLELNGLSKEDIRALIYEVANKYALEKESAWIDAVQQRSQGNPLYLKLLCDALENGSIALNDTKALPKEIDEYYKAILQRYAQDTLDGDALLAGLYTFAVAKDYLTFSHLALINKLGEAQVERVGSTLEEVLYENPLTENVLDYQLFHESFREYLLREKPLKITETNEHIIDYCVTWQELEGSWEQRYCLEHYATHLNESKKEARKKELLALFQNEAYTSTQKKVLKQFDATKKLYQLGLKKAGEIKENAAQLEAALCLVDLKHEEANDAPQIVALVANNEIDLALKRIESFGGNDKEGLKRKFILYMLCLMEMTLLDSKEKPFRKTAIEKLLNHFDENMPVDHSILSWNTFFPSYTMFLMACKWAELGLDYLLVYKRTDFWESDWISENGTFDDLQFEVLKECIREIDNEQAIATISSELAKIDKIEEALEFSNTISYEFFKSEPFATISIQLVKKGRNEEALALARGISLDYWKNIALGYISTELAKQGEIEEVASVMREIIACAKGIKEQFEKSQTLKIISIALAEQGKIEEALAYARSISLDDWKIVALSYISTELAKQGKIVASTSLIQEAIACAQGINNKLVKSGVISEISTELAKQGKIEESQTCARGIIDEEIKNDTLANFSSELVEWGKIEEAIGNAREISYKWQKSKVLSKISTDLTKLGKNETADSVMEEAIDCVREINYEVTKSRVLLEISTEYIKQGKSEKVASMIKLALQCSVGISGEGFIDNALFLISIELAKQGKIEEAFVCVGGIHFKFWKDDALNNISIELTKQGKIKEALASARGISVAKDIISINGKSDAISNIYNELFIQGKIEEATSILQEAIEYARDIIDEHDKSKALTAISNVLAEQGKNEQASELLNEAIECSLKFCDEREKIKVLSAITCSIAKQGRMEEANDVMQKALERSRELSDEWKKFKAFRVIYTDLAKHGRTEEAYKVILEALNKAKIISIDWQKMEALQSISTALASQGRIEEAIESASIITFEWDYNYALIAISIAYAKQRKNTEALKYANIIIFDDLKCKALKDISTELAKQGDWQLAETTSIEIPLIAERQSCWKTIAKNTCKEMGWGKALLQANQFISDEAQLFYLKGWTESVNLDDVDVTCLQEALHNLVYDSESIEELLQKYALNELFFGDASKEQINRLNKSLNIQWAIDIKAQFPSTEEMQRLSTNLEEWLHIISDEDDRDDIADWAKRVKDGKWTEEKFQEKIQEKLK